MSRDRSAAPAGSSDASVSNAHIDTAGLAEDPFQQMVSRLVHDMTALTAPPQQLADDAHYSRHHFARVVTAIAGETPTAFRRRILLERAAYRMIHSDARLVEIAQEAGFSSHAAFTRAFRRAFGTPPAVWRQRPTRFQIPAPNDVHFHPPGGLRLPARDSSHADDAIVQMVEHHVWMVERLVERAARLTGNQLDAQLSNRVEGIDGGSLRWLLSRLIGQMEMWLAAMEDREYDFTVERAESVTSMRQRVARVAPCFLTSVRTVSRERRFDETFVDAFINPPAIVTYGAMVAHVLTFSAHHRLLAVTRLAELGIDDLGYGDPKEWFTRPIRRLDR